MSTSFEQLDAVEFDSTRELALATKKQGLNLSELASNFRLHNFIKKSGAVEDRLESFMSTLVLALLPPKKSLHL